MASHSLSDCIRPEFASQYEEISNFLFEDPTSDRQQSGKFKIEGSFDCSYFHSSKVYYLSTLNDESHESIVRRVRAIRRQHHGLMEPKHFGQDPRTNHGVIRGLSMGPSMALQILMTMQGRTLNKALNMGREQIVSVFGVVVVVISKPTLHFCF